jgi:hypothetical protein
MWWGKKKRFASIYRGNDIRREGGQLVFLNARYSYTDSLSILECHGCLLHAFMLLFYRFDRWWWHDRGTDPWYFRLDYLLAEAALLSGREGKSTKRDRDDQVTLEPYGLWLISTLPKLGRLVIKSGYMMKSGSRSPLPKLEWCPSMFCSTRP